MNRTRLLKLQTCSRPTWLQQLHLHIHYRHHLQQHCLVSEDPLGAADDVQARGEKAITLRVPETLPADPVVTNIRGHRCISCHHCCINCHHCCISCHCRWKSLEV